MARADTTDASARASLPGTSAPPRVQASPAVLDLLERLKERYGPLVIHQSGGCCDGSAPICLPAAELPPSPSDVLLGRLGDTPVYIDGDQDQRWQYPELFIDVGQGEAMSLSLEGVEGVHLVAHQPCAR